MVFGTFLFRKKSLHLDNYESRKQHGYTCANHTTERKPACMLIVPELLSKKLEQKFDTFSNLFEGMNQLFDVNEYNPS